MKLMIGSAIFAVAMTVTLNSNAQAPAGSTGECKDGTFTSAESKRGACAGHGGVKIWNATAAPAKDAVATKATATAKTPATAAAPATAATVAPAAAATKSAATAMPTTAAAGGGTGKVWVNAKSKVYHCPTDKWYGKTKEGEYMTEAAAKAAGNHADHGKACS